MNGRRRPAAYRTRQRRSRQDAGCLPFALALGVLVTGGCLIALLAAQSLVRAAPSEDLLALLPLAHRSRPLTFLIMGIDRREGETDQTRSDSMILVGSHATTGEAALLSIPRDLWVVIPGVGEQRINTALFFGYDPTDPTTGPRLAASTVQQQFHRPVDRYLVLDFQTFVRLVDALGGIEVDVPVDITDTQYPTPDYGVMTIHFDAGRQQMDGQRALIYARTRHGDDDFGRSERQQQVIQALAARLVQPSTWRRLPEIYAVLRDGVQTDMAPADWPSLARIVLAVGQGNVRTATLEGATTPWTTSQGAWVLLPDWLAVDAIVSDLFGP